MSKMSYEKQLESIIVKERKLAESKEKIKADIAKRNLNIINERLASKQFQQLFREVKSATVQEALKQFYKKLEDSLKVDTLDEPVTDNGSLKGEDEPSGNAESTLEGDILDSAGKHTGVAFAIHRGESEGSQEVQTERLYQYENPDNYTGN